MHDREAISNVTVIAIEGRGLMLDGPPGSGKSTLALQLIDRGAVLVGDDGVVLTRSHDQLIATPPPNTAGKLEARNVGLVDLPTTTAGLSLVLRLSRDAPRFPGHADMCTLLGIAIPQLAFDPTIAAADLRAAWGLRLWGLPAAQSE